MGSLTDRLFRSVDASSLAFFRALFGFIMLWEVCRYFRYGWIERYYIRPDFHFTYYGFSWVAPWDGYGLYIHFAILGLLAFMIMIGACYRLSMVLFSFGFSYVFLLDQTQYLNHFYLVILLAFLMIVLPAHRAYSVDAWLSPEIRSRWVPAWSVWALRAQFEVLYLYAGIVKINPDWLHLQPLRMWLGDHEEAPVASWFLTQDWVVALAAYGVIAMHVIGAPLLLWRRTRVWVFAIYGLFHTANHFLFQIGIFPWLTLFGTLIFFEPDWPRQVLRNVGRWLERQSYAGERLVHD